VEAHPTCAIQGQSIEVEILHLVPLKQILQERVSIEEHLPIVCLVPRALVEVLVEVHVEQGVVRVGGELHVGHVEGHIGRVVGCHSWRGKETHGWRTE
jgi:hypothetical protein